jgi:histidinol-phosphate aminotransferase
VKDSFNSYPVDAHAQAVAAAAIADTQWFEQASNTIKENRRELKAGLEDLGFSVLASEANFLLARHPNFSGVELTEKLREAGILVRSWSSEDLKPWVRITVGTKSQQQTLLAELMIRMGEA